MDRHLLLLPTALSLSAGNSLSNCNRAFSCGLIVNVSNPLTGGDRPAQCGPPEFRLSCVGDSPKLTIDSLTYRVQALDETSRSLNLVRTDLDNNNTCLQQYANTTLNSTIFTVASDNEDLTLFYECSNSTTIKAQNLFSCEINGTETDNHYLLGAVPTDPILNISGTVTSNYYLIGAVPTDPILNVSKCNVSVTVPILQSAGSMLTANRSKLREVLMEGFEVNYTNPYEDQCVACGGIGGECGFDSDVGKPFCICGFGEVYKGRIRDGCLVAVKILIDSKSSPEEFINEVVSISRTCHINVITLLGFCYEGKKRALIFEYMPNGSLDKFIYSGRALNGSSSLEWKILYQIAIGIARGLEYLHRGCNTRILHFDIKPQNILVDRDFTPKISDLGLAKLCHGRESAISTPGMRGTVGFIAPKVIFRNLGRVSHKSDVYSYGMLVLEMVGFRDSELKIFNSSEMYFSEWIYRNLELGKDLNLPMDVTEEEEVLAKMMIIVSLWCIQTNPSDRPSIGKVIEMLEGSFESLQMPPKPIFRNESREDGFVIVV
ncbi:hypothetical protein BT93_L2767 [Corymbia citriodora subsp. variegata]|uniref:non-specific serine/threonine protein kinase n=1 Tax=Corymbia citriodora subsp. variegata TaxID=360336 RepID=A0A8T0CJ36_CORYI|nr:hypothetical protein BT93_L2767 [Corymbia citriodora subsp. variegata]